jgi:hypothetical protein
MPILNQWVKGDLPRLKKFVAIESANIKTARRYQLRQAGRCYGDSLSMIVFAKAERT